MMSHMISKVKTRAQNCCCCISVIIFVGVFFFASDASAQAKQVKAPETTAKTSQTSDDDFGEAPKKMQQDDDFGEAPKKAQQDDDFGDNEELGKKEKEEKAKPKETPQSERKYASSTEAHLTFLKALETEKALS